MQTKIYICTAVNTVIGLNLMTYYWSTYWSISSLWAATRYVYCWQS